VTPQSGGAVGSGGEKEEGQGCMGQGGPASGLGHKAGLLGQQGHEGF
jgi:hypothetical protein